MEPGRFCCCELVDATFPSRWSPALLLAMARHRHPAGSAGLGARGHDGVRRD